MTNPSALYNNVWMTITGAPGLGNVTLAAALLGYQTFAAAGVPNGQTVTCKFNDAAGAWEISSCVYSASGTSLARTLIESSTGSLLSLTSAATVMITAGRQDLATTWATNIQSFGDGSDGNVTISGAVTPTRDMYYNNLTLTTGAALNPNGFRIFVAGTLDLSTAPAGAIFRNASAGTNATSSSGGVSGSGPGGLGINGNGANDGTTGIATGAAPDGFPGGAAGGPILGGTGGASGAGGNGTGTNTGAVAQTSVPSSWAGMLLPYFLANPCDLGNMGYASAGGQGSSAGAGGGDGTHIGGSTGGAGAGGGPIFIAAAALKRGSSTAAACIQTKGSAPGASFHPTAGNVGGGGGSSGGGGGFVALLIGQLLGSVAANAIDVTGGNGTPGASGIGTGKGGGGGGSGEGGRVIIYDLQSGVLSVTVPAAAVTGTPTTTITGGAAGIATTSQVSI